MDKSRIVCELLIHTKCKYLDLEEKGMEEARRKIRVFLICVVMAAVLVGVIYYFTDVYGSSDISEGTLVMLPYEDGFEGSFSEDW